MLAFMYSDAFLKYYLCMFCLQIFIIFGNLCNLLDQKVRFSFLCNFPIFVTNFCFWAVKSNLTCIEIELCAFEVSLYLSYCWHKLLTAGSNVGKYYQTSQSNKKTETSFCCTLYNIITSSGLHCGVKQQTFYWKWTENRIHVYLQARVAVGCLKYKCVKENKNALMKTKHNLNHVEAEEKFLEGQYSST